MILNRQLVIDNKSLIPTERENTIIIFVYFYRYQQHRYTESSIRYWLDIKWWLGLNTVSGYNKGYLLVYYSLCFY